LIYLFLGFFNKETIFSVSLKMISSMFNDITFIYIYYISQIYIIYIYKSTPCVIKQILQLMPDSGGSLLFFFYIEEPEGLNLIYVFNDPDF